MKTHLEDAIKDLLREVQFVPRGGGKEVPHGILMLHFHNGRRLADKTFLAGLESLRVHKIMMETKHVRFTKKHDCVVFEL